MAAQSRVQTADQGMSSAAAESFAKASEFNAKRQVVISQVESLSQSFRGDAATRFVAAMEKWSSYCQQVTNLLEGMGETLQANVKGYGMASENTTHTAQSLYEALPGL